MITLQAEGQPEERSWEDIYNDILAIDPSAALQKKNDTVWFVLLYNDVTGPREIATGHTLVEAVAAGLALAKLRKHTWSPIDPELGTMQCQKCGMVTKDIDCFLLCDKEAEEHRKMREKERKERRNIS